MKGATTPALNGQVGWAVSIHAPNEGSDTSIGGDVGGNGWVSIHAPNEGSDCIQAIRRDGLPGFQSTLPMKGATKRFVRAQAGCEFQSTLPMKGATPSRSGIQDCNRFQSTLPMKGATRCGAVYVESLAFQSTLPMKGATSPATTRAPTETATDAVSIHAPNEGSDSKIWQKNKPARQIWAVHIHCKFINQ